MFTKLQLYNFQCHRNLTVPLSQITTICGESDTGKSAIMRSLSWLLFNNLQGDSFITHGQNECKVTLVADGDTITRIKNKTNNGYVLPDNSVCNAVGRDVPESILKLTKVSNLNVQYQFDAPFWFSLTAGQLAKELNQIADIAWLDRLQSQSNSDKRETQALYAASETNLNSLQLKVESLQWTENAETELQEVETLEKSVNKIKTKNELLESLLAIAVKYDDEFNNIQHLLKSFAALESSYVEYFELDKRNSLLTGLIGQAPYAIPDVAPLQNELVQICNLYERYSNLTELLNNVCDVPDTSKISAELNKVTKMRNDLDVLNTLLKNTPQAIPDVTPLQDETNKLHTLYKQYNNLTKLLNNIPEIPDTSKINAKLEKLTAMRNDLNTLTKHISTLLEIETALDKVEKGLVEMNELLSSQSVCPVCGSRQFAEK